MNRLTLASNSRTVSLTTGVEALLRRFRIGAAGCSAGVQHSGTLSSRYDATMLHEPYCSILWEPHLAIDRIEGRHSVADDAQTLRQLHL